VAAALAAVAERSQMLFQTHLAVALLHLYL
jgi:hypothetical protein